MPKSESITVQQCYSSCSAQCRQRLSEQSSYQSRAVTHLKLSVYNSQKNPLEGYVKCEVYEYEINSTFPHSLLYFINRDFAISLSKSASYCIFTLDHAKLLHIKYL